MSKAFLLEVLPFGGIQVGYPAILYCTLVHFSECILVHSSQFLVELGGLKCRYGLSGREVTPPAIDVMLVQQVFY